VGLDLPQVVGWFSPKAFANITMHNFVKSFLYFLLVAGLAVGALRAEEGGDSAIQFEEFVPKFAVDFGQIVKGRNHSSEFKYQPLNRNTINLNQTTKYGDSWKFDIGLMGLIWWPFNTNPTEPIHRTMRVEARLSQAISKWDFGQVAGTRFLEFGFFPYKYNPDAHNLGEYLYRSGTYPGVVYTTDGFLLMDHALYDAYGGHLHFSNFDGILNHEINFFSEQATAPTGDLTPAYELNVKSTLFELGCGIAFNRAISFRPRSLKPKTPENTFATVIDEVTDVNGIKDTVERSGRLDQLVTFNPLDTVIHSYWTKRGLKLMIRGVIDLGFLLPESHRGAEDLRIFAEAAILGWENQGFFYEKRSERVPIMGGINLPALGLLDLVSIQSEYYPARFDDIQSLTAYSLPIWDVKNFSTYNPSEYKRDDWKWSLYARKAIGKLFKVHAQIANDHLRLREFLQEQSGETLTRTPSHWYYLLRLECGL
jgi:hypothetical protein